VNGSGGLSYGEFPASVRSLLASPFALLLGTLGAGFLAIMLYLLFYRRDEAEKKVTSGSRLPRR
jgi:hypothetical protein